MYRPSFKSQVSKNRNPFMWCGKEANVGGGGDDEGRDNWPLAECKCSEEGKQLAQAPLTAIAIVEPRLMRMAGGAGNAINSVSGGTDSEVAGTGTGSGSGSNPPDWFVLPQAVDVNNDVMRLVSSLSTVVQILTRMTNAAAQELRQHPEREEGFQGLRMLLNYADQMYTTLLQPESVGRSANAQPQSLFHNLFEPMLGHQERRELVATRHPRPRSHPYRVVAVAASASESNANTNANANATGSANLNQNPNPSANQNLLRTYPSSE